jgi:DtxR family Mn-dependent transcriptional regulator
MFDKSINNKENTINATPLIKCLTECEKGEEVVVVSVNAGHKAKTRLANLGLVPGTKITKTKNAPFKGPLEIIVKGSSLVIGRGLASKIMVECNSTCLT